MNEKIKTLIENHKIIICVGPGGVGKTTWSATLGLAAAKLGKKAMVLTIDPAKRLKSALSLEEMGGEVQIQLPPGFPGQLFASAVDCRESMDRFVQQCSNQGEATRLMENVFYKSLVQSFSGAQELAALSQFYECTQNKKYDLLILDTPPSGHALDFLKSAQQLQTFTQGKALQWFSKKPGLLQKIFAKTSFTAFSLLHLVLGKAFTEAVFETFGALGALEKEITLRTGEVLKILEDPQTGIVLTTSISDLSIVKRFNEEIQQKNLHLAGIFLNRAFWKQSLPPVDPQLKKLYKDLRYHSLEDSKLLEELLDSNQWVIKIPEIKITPNLKGLETLLESVEG